MENLVHGTFPLLLAIATMALVVRAMEWHGPFVALWRRLCRLERMLAAMALLAVVGYGGGKGTTNNPSCGGTTNYPSCGGDTDSPSAGVDAGGPSPLGSFAPPRNAAVPAWFGALGYPSTDSDGDGIPDCWERWTRTDPNADDSGLDPDGDGVDNLEEFLNQCDPMLADTDGDSLSDRYEIDSAAQGRPWADPVSPAVFPGDGPDSDGDGTPDSWEGSGIRYGVSHPFSDGFPGGIAWPYEGPGNIDVTATISSSRSAKLSWGDAPGQSIVVQPCTNLEVRLRLASAELTTLELSAATASSTGGLWKARMELSWGWRRHQQTDLNRVRAGNGDVLEWDAMFGEYSGPDAPAPRPPLLMASPASSGDNVIRFYLRKKTLTLDVVGTCCPIHGGLVTVTATGTNVTPPYVWTVDWQVQTEMGPVLRIDSIPGNGATVTCQPAVERDMYSNVILMGTAYVESTRCRGPSTNIVGAAWTSTHDPDDPSDHLPGVSTISVTPNPGICPPATNVTCRVGWTHDEQILHIRNLVRILTGDPMDDETDHCIGLVWEENMVVDLYDYLDESCRAIASQLRFRVTPSGGLVTRHLSVGTQPRILQPQVFHIEIVDGEQSQTFDRMWIVVNNPSDDSSFGSWYSVNSTNLAWVATLPRPYASLTYTTNFAGVISASIPAPTSPNRWDNPDPTDGNLLHHAAKFSMRSVTVPGGHTNQACYDEYGQLIRSGISGGTADFAAGNFWHVRSHVREDVYPFLHAVRLDGNPGEKTPMNNITRPCLYEGEYIDKYIECRPIVQP